MHIDERKCLDLMIFSREKKALKEREKMVHFEINSNLCNI